MIITHNKINNLHLNNEHLHNLFLCNDTNLDENEHWGDEMKKNRVPLFEFTFRTFTASNSHNHGISGET